jgi:pimeloyl-ACP methyl ester carboxylesterase
MTMILANGLRTHVQTLGAVDPRGLPPLVVCVHGLGYDSLASFYLTLGPPLAESGLDVLAYDLRGHGRSERPRRGYRLGDFVEDLAAVLEENGDGRPAHLIGNSFGGTVALSFAARSPERVASVVAIEAEPATPRWIERMGGTMRNVIEALDDAYYMDWIGRNFGLHYQRLTRAAAAVIRSTTLTEDVVADPPLTDRELAAIACPVLSVVGSEGFQAQEPTAVQNVLPRCRTLVIPGQGHSVLVERHRTLRGPLVEWIAALEPGWSPNPMPVRSPSPSWDSKPGPSLSENLSSRLSLSENLSPSLSESPSPSKNQSSSPSPSPSKNLSSNPNPSPPPNPPRSRTP